MIGFRKRKIAKGKSQMLSLLEFERLAIVGKVVVSSQFQCHEKVTSSLRIFFFNSCSD